MKKICSCKEKDVLETPNKWILSFKMIPNFWIKQLRQLHAFCPVWWERTTFYYISELFKVIARKVVFKLRLTLQRMAFWALWVTHSTLQLASGIFRDFFFFWLREFDECKAEWKLVLTMRFYLIPWNLKNATGSSCCRLQWFTILKYLQSGEMETVVYGNVKDKVNMLLCYFIKTLVALKRISSLLLQLWKIKSMGNDKRNK